jgi:hypothetical protein
MTIFDWQVTPRGFVALYMHIFAVYRKKLRKFELNALNWFQGGLLSNFQIPNYPLLPRVRPPSLLKNNKLSIIF